MKFNLDNTEEQFDQKVGNYFRFSTANLDNPGASEFTLVNLTVDVSSSVASFVDLLNKAVHEVVTSLKHSPRVNNLMFRVSKFGSSVSEIQGFRFFKDINPDDYSNLIVNPQGMTALIDGTVDGIDALYNQAKDLYSKDFDCCNAVEVLITDGENNHSQYDYADIKRLHAEVLKSEALESMRRILIGVNPTKDQRYAQYLTDYQQKAGYDQFIEVDEVTPSKFAQLADFISKSVSTQSQALGSGQPSQAIKF